MAIAQMTAKAIERMKSDCDFFSSNRILSSIVAKWWCIMFTLHPAASTILSVRWPRSRPLLQRPGIYGIVLATCMAKIAIIETGGKQYVVTQDSVLSVEKLEGAEKKGDKITFDKVLLTDDGSQTKVGKPYVAGAKVSAELIENGRAPKVTVIRYREKSRYYKKRGHRQPFTKVRITALP